MRSRCAYLLLAAAACGDSDSPPATDGIRSGSRLRARFLVDGEGARQFETFHDRELGLDCSFQGDPPRCLPDVTDVRTYSDPECRVPILGRGVSDPECATIPDYIGVPLDGECESGFQEIWKRGPRVMPDEIYGPDAYGVCAARAPRIDYEYYLADVELPVEDFVAATYEFSGEGRLRDVVTVGEDGSRQPVGFHDEDLDAACTLDELIGVCVPEFGQHFWYDALCSEPIAAAIPSACAPVPRFVGSYASEGDGTYSLALFERGAEFTPSVVFYGDDARSCEWAPMDSTYTYYLASDDIVGDLAELHPVAGDDRRLQGYYLSDEEGSRQRVDGFHDREGNFDCHPVQTGPTSWRCVPSFGSTAAQMFADPLCEQEIDVLERRPTDPAEPPSKPRRGIVWRPAGDDACASYAHLHVVGGELSSGSVYVPRLLGCQRLTWDLAEVRRFAIGAEMPFDDYVLMTRVTE